MAEKYLPPKDKFIGKTINSWKLEREIGRGKIGIVYYATQNVTTDSQDKIAIKIIPKENLKSGWEIELDKVFKLAGIPQVVQYRGRCAEILDAIPYVCILWEYIDGFNLRDYIKHYPTNITLEFIENLLYQILQVFLAMNETQTSHGDLHEGNIMIANPDPRLFLQDPIIKVGDFGIGGSHNELTPKDDYVELINICLSLLEKFIDPAKLDNTDNRNIYKYFIEDFLFRRLPERNPSAGDFVRNPRRLIEIFQGDLRNIRSRTRYKTPLILNHPFDYLSCEQIGDSFELLQTLYSSNFPGYGSLLQRVNTILTGPRGCGKTTIFRNLSLKAQLLSKKKTLNDINNYIGIYYYCSELFFAFHYLKGKPSDYERKIIIHYFNLSILHEIFDILIVAQEDPQGKLSIDNLSGLERFFKDWSNFSSPPQGTDLLRHLLSLIEQDKHRLGLWLRQGRKGQEYQEKLLPPDFIPILCKLLQDIIPWINGNPLYFFLDDYSMPRVSSEIQRTLNDIIMYRWSSCFFKVSTESITTFFPYDTSKKLIEETREYDIVDFGQHFMKAQKERKTFLEEVINNRLKYANGIYKDYKDIKIILGEKPYKSYNDLARQIRRKKEVNGEQKHKRIFYAGMDTINDLFSGDIADILRLVRDVFSGVGSNKFVEPGLQMPVDFEIQDRAIREYGASFLNRVEAAPETGPKLRKIAESFGFIANWIMKNFDSKNEKQHPPWQAFRIEIRDSFSFNDKKIFEYVYNFLIARAKQNEYPLDRFIRDIQTYYNDLLRYGVFLRDVRGKSQRGSVIPRLYLRRLLIPTFVLTPNQRDSIGLEINEFLILLYDPDKFKQIMQSKERWETPERSPELFNE